METLSDLETGCQMLMIIGTRQNGRLIDCRRSSRVAPGLRKVSLYVGRVHAVRIFRRFERCAQHGGPVAIEVNQLLRNRPALGGIGMQ